MKPINKIGIITGGGDCSGLNAVISAATKTALTKYNVEVVGYMRGYFGLYNNDFISLNHETVSGITHQGGTILKSSNKDNLFNYRMVDEQGNVTYKDVSDVAVENMKKEGVDALIVIGGDGTLTSARDFNRKGIPVVGVPKTIDNDLPSTDVTFGYNTALTNITDALDKVHTTAASHDRVLVVEVMGRHTGWLALEGGFSGSADAILIPEIPYDLRKVASKIKERRKEGKYFSIIVVSEGAKPKDGKIHVRETIEDSADTMRLGGVGERIKDELSDLLGDQEVRYTNLSYLQRGGITSTFDRTLAQRFGVSAVDTLMQGGGGKMVRYSGRQITHVDLEDVVGSGDIGETSKGGAKYVDSDGQIVNAAKAIGISFGD